MSLVLEYGYGLMTDKETKNRYYADIKSIGESFKVAIESTKCDDHANLNKHRLGRSSAESR